MERETAYFINNLTKKVILLYGRNLKRIIKKLGGKLIIENYDYLTEGSIKKVNDSFIIRVPKNDDWIIAIQIGHLLLHMGFKTNPEIWNKQKNEYRLFKTSEQTAQAVCFARCILGEDYGI